MEWRVFTHARVIMGRPAENKFNSEPRPGEKEAAKNYIDRIVGTRTFEPFERGQDGAEIFRFKHRGDELVGTLGPPRANLQNSTSYPIKLDDGRTVEFFGSRLLHKIIRDGELIGAKVRIVFIGWQHTGYQSHKRKIYRVYKLQGFGLLAPVTETPVYAKQKKARAKRNGKKRTA